MNKDIAWNTASFVKSAKLTTEYPRLVNLQGKPLPEIAIVGRSNVGKSSLLNDFLSCKQLAKTAKTPGKTQLINFFRLGDNFTLVDLPGYGYAKVAKTNIKEWGAIIDQYLRTRETLVLLIFLMDIRRTPNSDDLLFLEWAKHYKKNLLLVFTKTDKVSRDEKKKNVQTILSMIPDHPASWLCYSTKTHEGRTELRQLLQNYAAY